MALNEVSRDELQAVIAQLKESSTITTMHGALIRTLICNCGKPARKPRSRFGQWYYSLAPKNYVNIPDSSRWVDIAACITWQGCC